MVRKVKHPKCPVCGKEMRIVAPINMAICDNCNKKYYIEKDEETGEYKVLGDYYAIRAEKMKEEMKEETAEEKPKEEISKEETNWIEEKSKEEETKEEEEKTEEKEKGKEALKTPQIEKEEEGTELPLLLGEVEDPKVKQYKEYVQKYVYRRYWINVARDELKKMVAELYDAGALGSRFSPYKVAQKIKNFTNKDDVLPFYGVEWLDRAITKELVTRIWLKLQDFKAMMDADRLKYYVAIFHPEDLQELTEGKMSDLKIRKYMEEMDALEEE